MFDNIVVLDNSLIDNISLVDFDTLNINTIDNKKYYLIMNTESIIEYYRNIKISYKLSKDLYKANITNWRSLIDDNCNEDYNRFINNSIFIIDESSNMIISILSPDDIDGHINKEYIEDRLNIIRDIFDDAVEYYSNCMYKLVIDNSDTESRMVFEINIARSFYRIYTMKKYNDLYIPMFSTIPTLYTNNFRTFLETDFDYEIKLISTLNKIDEFVPDSDIFSNMKLSLREVLNVIKWSKLKIITDSNGMCDSVELSSDNSYKFLINYLNSFNMPYKSLNKLNDTRRIAKYSDIDFIELVRFLENEFYFTNKLSNISMRIINYLFDCIEKSDVECLIEELNIEM